VAAGPIGSSPPNIDIIICSPPPIRLSPRQAIYAGDFCASNGLDSEQIHRALVE